MALKIQTTESVQTSSQSTNQTSSDGDSKPRQSLVRTSSGEIKPTLDGFQDATVKLVPRLIVGIQGEERCGKNHFGFTAPGPHYLQTCDPNGTEGVKQKFVAKGKVIKVASYTLGNIEANASTAQIAAAAAPVWDKFVANYRAALTVARTIIWDTGDEFWELLRLATFGEAAPKLSKGDRNNIYGELNGKFEGLIKESWAYSVNMVIIHRLKDEYVSDSKTGKRIRAGYKDINFLTQVNLLAKKYPKVGTDAGGNQIVVPGAEFRVHVLDCRRNPDIEGAVMNNDFMELAMAVLPEVDPTVWL